MNDFENYVYEPIDLCACYEPMVEAPREVIDEWKAAREAELEEPNGVTTYYGRMGMEHCTSITAKPVSKSPNISMTVGSPSVR